MTRYVTGQALSGKHAESGVVENDRIESNPATRGLLHGFLGVAIFSVTLPATRVAVAEIDPVFVALGRAFVAALCAAAFLLATRATRPARHVWKRLFIVAVGVVVGFPLLTSIAMQSLPAAHGAIVIGILPLATAVCAMAFAHERPSAGFWVCAATGSTLVLAFALREGGGSFHAGDALMLAAVALAGIGYAEGGRLARTMGGANVIAWALLLAMPLVAPITLWLAWRHADTLAVASTPAWLGFAYVSLFSMLIGFFFWYRGLALGGVARVGQVQLLQPFLSLLAAAFFAGEPLRVDTMLFAVAVIAVVAIGRRFSVRRRPVTPQ